MNPLTDINFWLYLGSLISATAIALFAIKSGYFEKRLRNLYETIAKLVEFKEEIDRFYKEVYGESISLSDYNCEYGELTLVKELPKISEVDLLDLISSWKRADRDDVMKLKSINESFFREKIIPDIYDRYSKYLSPYELSKIIEGSLNFDNVTKNALIPVYDVATTVIEAKKNEYKLIDSKKKKFDEIFSDERILYLFGTGISIQLLSLFAPHLFIITVVASSLPIVLMIKIFYLLF